MEMSLGPNLLSLYNFRALVGQEGKLGQMWFKMSKMGQTWPEHGLNIASVIQHSVDISRDFSQILKHFKQVEAKIQ